MSVAHSWLSSSTRPIIGRIRSAAGTLLPQTGWTFDLVGGAGGPAQRAGDYLVRDGLMPNQVNAGLWFLLRVDATPTPDLRPLGQPLPPTPTPDCTSRRNACPTPR
jgi:hypothetical protein